MNTRIFNYQADAIEEVFCENRNALQVTRSFKVKKLYTDSTCEESYLELTSYCEVKFTDCWLVVGVVIICHTVYCIASPVEDSTTFLAARYLQRAVTVVFKLRLWPSNAYFSFFRYDDLTWRAENDHRTQII